MNPTITHEEAIEIATELIKDNPRHPIVSVTALLEEDYGVWAFMFTVDDDIDPADIMIEVDIVTREAWYFVHP